MPNAQGGVARYPHLFTDLTIGPVVVPNRIVRTAHGTNLTPGGLIGDALIAYHEERARDGVGLTILELAPVHPSSVSGGIQIWKDEVEDGYLTLVEALRPYPMKLFQQISHVGHNSVFADGRRAWAPSAVRVPRRDAAGLPIPMTLDQIDIVVEAFAAAAARCVRVGLDGVEVHAAHGHLIGQFLSPLTNHREDEFGGSLENRMRFLIRVMEAVRARVGSEIAVGARLSSDELAEGGVGHDEVIEIARALESRGLVDFLDLSIGSSYSYNRIIGGMDEPQGYQLEHSLTVSDAVSVPTIVVGRILGLDEAERIVADGRAELVSLVRATIADPRLVTKSRDGRPELVRPCIGCNQGCVGGNGSGGHIGCVVNPSAGAELTFAPTVTLDGIRHRVVVVGGGPAGMEAARVAAERGHDVVLYEAEHELGGQLRLARQLPFRSEIGAIADWLAAELHRLKVDVRLGIHATAGLIEAEGADLVVVATGSRATSSGFQTADPLLEPIPGSDLPHVVTTRDVIAGAVSSGSRAVVLDDVGHYEAAGVAELLVDRGYQVHFVTGFSRVAPLMEPARTAAVIRGRLVGRPFIASVESELVRIAYGRVTVRSTHGGPAEELEADLVVTALAPEAVDELASLPAAAVVGDAGGARFLQVAIAEGNRAAARLPDLVLSADPRPLHAAL